MRYPLSRNKSFAERLIREISRPPSPFLSLALDPRLKTTNRTGLRVPLTVLVPRLTESLTRKAAATDGYGKSGFFILLRWLIGFSSYKYTSFPL